MNPHDFLTMYIWDVHVNRMVPLSNSIHRCLNHLFLLEQLKITRVGTTSRKDGGVVLRHGRTCSKMR